jgi:hypothetical protein
MRALRQTTLVLRSRSTPHQAGRHLSTTQILSASVVPAVMAPYTYSDFIVTNVLVRPVATAATADMYYLEVSVRTCIFWDRFRQRHGEHSRPFARVCRRAGGPTRWAEVRTFAMCRKPGTIGVCSNARRRCMGACLGACGYRCVSIARRNDA